MGHSTKTPIVNLKPEDIEKLEQAEALFRLGDAVSPEDSDKFVGAALVVGWLLGCPGCGESVEDILKDMRNAAAGMAELLGRTGVVGAFEAESLDEVQQVAEQLRKQAKPGPGGRRAYY